MGTKFTRRLQDVYETSTLVGLGDDGRLLATGKLLDLGKLLGQFNQGLKRRLQVAREGVAT